MFCCMIVCQILRWVQLVGLVNSVRSQRIFRISLSSNLFCRVIKGLNKCSWGAWGWMNYSHAATSEHTQRDIFLWGTTSLVFPAKCNERNGFIKFIAPTYTWQISEIILLYRWIVFTLRFQSSPGKFFNLMLSAFISLLEVYSCYFFQF